MQGTALNWSPEVSYSKGIAYFTHRADAVRVRDMYSGAHPQARVVEYQKGYAVQYRLSGPYFPEMP